MAAKKPLELPGQSSLTVHMVTPAGPVADEETDARDAGGGPSVSEMLEEDDEPTRPGEAMPTLPRGVAPEQPVETEARRLKVLLGLVREESILQGRNLGLRFTADGYQFFVLNGRQWVPLEADQMLRQREMPAELRLELEAEGERFEFFPSDDDKDKDKDAKQDTPQVYFLASGEVSPFNLTLRPFEGNALLLRVSEGGAVEIEALKR